MIAANNGNLVQVISDRSEHTESTGACVLELPSDWKPENLILGGGYFTECELSMLEGRFMKFADRANNVKSVPMDCDPPLNTKL